MGTLSGDLALMPIEKILNWVAEGKKSGFLTLSNGRAGREIYLKDGAIAFCSFACQGDQLEKLLTDRGLIDLQRLQSLDLETGPQPFSLAESLLENEVIPAPELEQVMIDLVARELREPLSWRAGSFDFIQNLPLPMTSSPLNLPIEAVVARATALAALEGPRGGENESLVRQISQRIMDGDFELPPIPDTILKIHRCLNDENGSARDAVRIISADQVLTSKILKTANSAFFSLLNPVASVQHAIVCIGFKAVQGIVTAQTLNSIFVRNREAVRRVLQHGFKCACLARKLAAATGANEEEAFVCGLLHNIGKTALMNLCGDYGVSREGAEGLSDRFHQQVGVLLAAKWNLPEVVIESIQYHHAPGKSHFPGNTVELVYLANGLLNFPEMQVTLQYACKRTDFSRVDVEALLAEVPALEKLAGELL